MSKVITKKVPGFSNYSVTNTGEVISHRFGKNRTLATSSTSGYKSVSLVNDKGQCKNFQVHRLVAQVFLKNPKEHPIVNHKDGDKLNNLLSNLEWTDRKGNAQHYEAIIKPKNVKAKIEKTQSELMTRLKIISDAHTACTNNPELFFSLVKTTLQGIKGL